VLRDATRGVLTPLLIGATVLVVGLLLVPSRMDDASFPWFEAQNGDAGRYLLMVEGYSQPYPWGGRWLVPTIASLVPWESTDALWAVNVLLLGLFAVVVSAQALALTSRTASVVSAWLFAAGGVGLMLLFQNPFLTDTAALLLIAVMGSVHMRGTATRSWWLGLLVPLSCTVRESCVIFLLLLAADRRWRVLAVSALLCAVALLFGFQLADAGGSTVPTFGLGMIVKIYVGLGALWILMLGAVWLQRGSSRPVGQGRFLTFAAVCAGLVAVGILTATDTPRMVAFLLPAAVPLAAVLLAGLTSGRALGLAAAAVPAVLVVIPTRLTWTRVPRGMAQLEDWYAANWLLLLAAMTLAAAGAFLAVLLVSAESRPPQRDET
jgi:hypothetical protein